MANKIYTGRGDGGTTSVFGCAQRISKSACQIEALGSVDEVNSFVGWCRAQVNDQDIKQWLEEVQQNLSIVQAEIAGAEKNIKQEQVELLEQRIAELSAELPKITNFVLPGATTVAAMLDVARTMARRAERRVIEAVEKKEVVIGTPTLAYLNRLSSLLYAMARVTVVRSREQEQTPKY